MGLDAVPLCRDESMTKQKSFKQRVRARMAKTGETYTTARRMLIASGTRPRIVKRPFEPWISEARMREATGRGWQDWFALLDACGGVKQPHRELARRLTGTHRVDPWWAQTITVGFEQARGLREPGQHADGWAASASKTVGVPVQRLFRAFTDPDQRERWLPGAELRLRTETPPRSARYDWEDGSTRVHIGFVELGESKSRIALAHERLPDADTAAEMKTWWRERVAALKDWLERATEVGADVAAVRERVEQVLARLPEAQAVPVAGHLSLEVRRKRFGWFLVDHHGDGRLAIHCKATSSGRADLLETLPQHAHVPKHVGHHGWVGLWLETDSDAVWTAVAGALEQAYRMTAPRGLLGRGGFDT